MHAEQASVPVSANAAEVGYGTELELHAIRTFTWRGKGATLALTLETARPAHDRVLVRFAGVNFRQDDWLYADEDGLIVAQRALL